MPNPRGTSPTSLTRVRGLIVEDSPDDAELIVRELSRAAYDVSWTRVDSAAALRFALKNETWDVVLSDFTLPQFSASAALAVLQESRKDVPFIVVSGGIGEEAAVALMRAGAADYIYKDGSSEVRVGGREEFPPPV